MTNRSHGTDFVLTVNAGSPSLRLASYSLDEPAELRAQENLSPAHVIAAHLRTSSLSMETMQVLNLVPNAVIFETANEQFVID